MKRELFRVINRRKLAALAFAAILLLAQTTTALAQNAGFDPFGQNDDSDSWQSGQPGSWQSGQGGASNSLGFDADTQALFGHLVPNPTPTPAWTDFNTAADGMDSMKAEAIYKETADYRMRKELEKPLQKRDPFADRLGDIERELNPPDLSGQKRK